MDVLFQHLAIRVLFIDIFFNIKFDFFFDLSQNVKKIFIYLNSNCLVFQIALLFACSQPFVVQLQLVILCTAIVLQFGAEDILELIGILRAFRLQTIKAEYLHH
jgi:hypothetical protein